MRCSNLFLMALCASLSAGCVGYRTHVVRVEDSAAALPPALEGPLTFEEAVRLLVARNPELKATRAAVASVNLSPGPKPLLGSTQVMDGALAESMLRTDVLSLLGLGPRKAERALARALADERVRRHHERTRDLVAELAEAFAVEQVLRELADPAVELDVDAFERARLAPRAVLAAARSVAAEGAAERQVIASRLGIARLQVLRLVGAAPGLGLRPAGTPADWPEVAPPDRRRLALARGDLQRLLAAWHVADRRYRYEVARQFPNLSIGLGGNLALDVPMQLIQLELPLDAPAAARAAEQARRVAFHRLEAGILAALHEAGATRLEVSAAAARLEAATERRRAAEQLLQAERAHLQTDPAALERVVLVAGRVVDAARQQRESGVAVARARVRAARAAGWPTPEQVGGGA